MEHQELDDFNLHPFSAGVVYNTLPAVNLSILVLAQVHSTYVDSFAS